MKKAIIYCRFSPRPNADECKSNEKQSYRCRAYCERQEPAYYQYDEFEDTAVSGRALDRPGLAAAIEALEPGMVLVVDTVDRLARDMLVNLTIRHQVEKAGATIEFADGSPNEDTPEGKLFSHILSAFAAYERDRIAARTSAGLKRKQANGEYLGRPPVGYRVVDKKLVEHEGEQQAIQTAKRLVNESSRNTSERIANYVTRWHGLFRGKPWSARTIRRIIQKSSE
jgi:DNA invertase Pin-like site-specific DNA recombinase